jgi:SRSO17 transposase
VGERSRTAQGVPEGVVLADAGYGNDTQFRAQLTEWKLPYVAGIQSTVTIWKPGEQPAPAPKRKGLGRPPRLLQRDAQHQPVMVKDLALSLPASAWKKISWRQGVRGNLASRFTALRVRPAHRDYWRAEPHPEEWLLIEWPEGESEPAKYWLSTLPAGLEPTDLVHRAKHRWIIERDYQELKQELGLGHFEGRGWRGFHHHATLCLVSYGFLVAERSRFSPSARAKHLGLRASKPPQSFCGSPRTPRTA